MSNRKLHATPRHRLSPGGFLIPVEPDTPARIATDAIVAGILVIAVVVLCAWIGG